MPHTTFEKSFELQANQAVSIGECKGRWLRASHGVAWITIAGVGQDIFLSAGQCRQINHSGAVVLEALGGPAGVELGRQGAAREVAPKYQLSSSSRQRETVASA